MKALKMCIYSGLILISLSYCKNNSEPQKENTLQAPSSSNPQASNMPANGSEEKDNPLLIATPEGYYEPKGLRKLTLIEMYNFGTSSDIKNTFPLKDKDGRPTDWKIMQEAGKMMFIQMYANEEGKVVEGVVFPLTDSIKAMIMKIRMASN